MHLGIYKFCNGIVIKKYPAIYLVIFMVPSFQPNRLLKMMHGKFMAYKALKKKVKLINPHSNGKTRSRSGSVKFSDGGSNEGNLPTEDMGFTLLLNRELDKIYTFYIDKEEDYIIRFRELEIRAENSNGNEEMLEVQKEILDFHSEMVMLLNYSVINFAGIYRDGFKG
ncbi:hypothetical protein CRYUN_Cryun37aG0032600 [Craigia yunnanensis]